MSAASRKLIVGTILALAAGGLLGWLYGQLLAGFLLASLAVLFVYVRKLVQFERAVNNQDLESIRYGDGIWQRLYSQFKYERERAGRYKKQTRRLFREIQKSTNAMPDGAIIIDSNNEIVACNRAAKTLIGLKRKKDRGQRLDNMYRDPELTRLLQANDATLTADLESPLRDNEWLNCRVVPYGPDQKLVLIRDVTERIILNKIRRDFVANASHELRSPLTVISGYLESMADDPRIPGELAQPLAQMQSQARRMTAIIKDLLELSRLEGDGRASLDEAVNVVSVVTHTLDTLQPGSDGPGIRTRLDSGLSLLGAAGDLESIVRNLLGNALRHTPAEGQIEIIWRATADGAELIVRDTGEGIAPEHIPRLTERFFRVDRGRARGDGGFGLGLAIVKHSVERHDGELLVASEPGQGSEFRCKFPPSRLVVT